LFIAGDQLPEILFNEVVGKALKVSPLQIGFTEVKVGIVFTGKAFIVSGIGLEIQLEVKSFIEAGYVPGAKPGK